MRHLFRKSWQHSFVTRNFTFSLKHLKSSRLQEALRRNPKASFHVFPISFRLPWFPVGIRRPSRLLAVAAYRIGRVAGLGDAKKREHNPRCSLPADSRNGSDAV